EHYRQSWRLRIPPDPGETRRIERWLATARLFLAVSALVAIQMDPTELLHSPRGRGGTLPWPAFAGLHVNVPEFEPNRLFMQSVYLLVMGLLLGYLAEQQKHLRAEKAVVTGTLSRIR